MVSTSRRARSRRSAQQHRGPIVIDADVYGADLAYGALLRGWGAARLRKLEARITAAEIVHCGPELVLIYAQLRVKCQRAGHALSQREHDADRWIAAMALRLGIPLVSNDGIFVNVPGLELEASRER